MILTGSFKVRVSGDGEAKDFSNDLHATLTDYDLHSSWYQLDTPQREPYDVDDYGEDDYGDEDQPDSVKAAGQASVEAFTPLRTLFIRLAARRSGKSEAEVSKALAHLEADSGRPFLDWLLDGGLEKLIDILLKLLPLLV